MMESDGTQAADQPGCVSVDGLSALDTGVNFEGLSQFSKRCIQTQPVVALSVHFPAVPGQVTTLPRHRRLRLFFAAAKP